jgi:4-hydroxybenzoate polyprenyltransferase
MSFIARIRCYCQEQLEPGSRLFLSLVVSFFIYLVIKLDHQLTSFRWDFLVPAFGTYFLLIYYRISDEFKDLKTDQKFFPDRPIPSGRLFLSDLKIMLFGVSIMGIILNLFYPAALVEFFFAFVFTVAMGKWFFMEKLISNNRLIAFFTHAPVGFFLYWYNEVFLLNQYHVSWSLMEKGTIIAFIIFPGFVWEILRKTYLPQDEMPGYQIYSTMLGFKGSLLFGSFFVVLALINNFVMISLFPFMDGLSIALLLLNVILLVVILLHALKPRIKNLKAVAEIYMSLHLLLPLAVLIYQVWGN